VVLARGAQKLSGHPIPSIFPAVLASPSWQPPGFPDPDPIAGDCCRYIRKTFRNLVPTVSNNLSQFGELGKIAPAANRAQCHKICTSLRIIIPTRVLGFRFQVSGFGFWVSGFRERGFPVPLQGGRRGRLCTAGCCPVPGIVGMPLTSRSPHREPRTSNLEPRTPYTLYRY
jgi:hypothetical protein